MSTFVVMEDISSALEQNGNVMSITMEELRDAHQAGRLGVHVRKSIRDKLRSLSIGHLPQELPDSQNGVVRLYRLGTPIASLIEAVVYPGEANDAKIRAAAGGEDTEIIRKIRELICQ